MNYIINDNIQILLSQELDNLKGTTSNIQTQLNQISPNVGTIIPVNEIITNNDSLNVFANKTQGQIDNIKATGISVSTNGIQTLTNKTLEDCDANTQLLTDDSTKIATTNYVNQQIAANSNNVITKLNVAEIDNNLNPLLIGETASTITIGNLSNVDNKVINIGGANDVVNILGSTNFIQTTNTKVQNKVMVLNDGAVGNNQAAGSGIHFKDNDVSNKGYMIVGANGTSLDFKAPQSNNIFKMKDTPSESYDITNKLYVDIKSKSINSWFSVGYTIYFDDYLISMSGNSPYLRLAISGSKYVMSNAILNYATNGGGCYGQSFNQTITSSSTLILVPRGLVASGDQASGSIWDYGNFNGSSGGKYYKYTIMCHSPGGYYIFNIERFI